MGRLSLVGGTVLTLDRSRRILEPGTVIIENSRIVDVLEGSVSDGEKIDCTGKVIMPGLVNAHVHTSEVLWRGSGGSLPTVDWIRTRKHPLVASLDGPSIEVGMRLACAEMAISGTTSFLDPEVPPRHASAAIQAAESSGLRANLAVTVPTAVGYGHAGEIQHDPQTGQQDYGFSPHDHGDTSNDSTEWEPESWLGTGRTRLWLGLQVLSGADIRSGSLTRALADKHGLRITYHAAENTHDVEAIRSSNDLDVTSFAQSLGLLGDDVVISHGVHVSQEDIRRLHATGTSVVHCPSSNARTGSGVAPVPSYLDEGVTIGLGTDGGMVNDTYDILAEMRSAALIHGATRIGDRTLAPEQILDMATVNGSRMLGLSGGGLEVGAPADIMVADLQRLGSWPTADVIDSLIYAADRSCVRHVLVDGELIVTDGELIGVDIPALLNEAHDVAQETFRAAGLSVLPRVEK